MSHFNAAELAYLASQRLGRLATIDPDGAPNAVPVSFIYNAEQDTIDIRGFNMTKSKKFRNIVRDGRVAFVIDDSPAPRQGRAIEIRGVAQAVPVPGLENDVEAGSHLIRITATEIITWGLEAVGSYKPLSRKIT